MVKRTKAKIFVKVDLEVNAFVGESASQLTQVLGTLVREHAPTNAIYWKDFDPITKDAIVQGALEALKQLEDESFINGEELSPAELSQKVFGKKNYLKGLGPNMKLKKKNYCKPNSIYSGEMQAELETLRSLNKENEEKFVSQDAMNKLLRVQIESQNKKIETLQIRYTRFVDLILLGGSSVDLNLIRQIDSD